MKGRGQENFLKLPGLAAWLYDRLMRSRAIERQSAEIAADLLSRVKGGRVLDVGTGPGRLLLRLHQLDGRLQLYGLDISQALVERARKTLAGLPVDLRQGDIEQTPYPDDSFDLVTCTGSFYLWDHPVQCLDEIHRILKPGGSAYLYETYRDYDQREFRQALRENLRSEGVVRRLITPHFLKRQLGMTYITDEVETIVRHSQFGKDYVLEKLRLGGLPVWLRIRLDKTG